MLSESARASKMRAMPIRLAGLALAAIAVAGATTVCGRAPAAVQPAVGPVVVVANQRKGVATLIEVGSGRVVAQIDAGMKPHEVAASPDGRLVALAAPSWLFGDAREIAILEVATATRIRQFNYYVVK
jgi:hypothetical protein